MVASDGDLDRCEKKNATGRTSDRGSGFSGESRVLVNGVEVPTESMTVDPHELILFIPPSGTVGAVSVTVENPGGQVSATFSGTFSGAVPE
jgi:hypothetical protein